ncbi:hypothetical protein BT93_L2514 [Corymbia citriodora subsp. variegata]|uniref:Protein kinase domain-containing protein n=1 Tax=Corymbia citriodora subsp. variegata TaxID=360336 RepID=A0A8T0CJU2_CORYI|nr:hypothetical protein BT93_L2514 [Corymbia citriodora subsp. variegata]
MSSYQYDFSNINRNTPSDFDKFNESAQSTMDHFLAAAIISAVVGTAATVAVVYFLIDCLKKAGSAIPSYAKIATNDWENFPQVIRSSPDGEISVAPAAISPGDNWEVPDEYGTLEGFLKPTRFSSDQLAAYTRDYATLLGSGAYGVVFKGELPNGTPVAIKVLTNAHDKRIEDQFMAEVSSIGRIHHINLVKLDGFCFDRTTRALIYEYMENGSLDGFLFGDKTAIDWCKMHEIAVGTAKGIAYLHEECEQRIVHYDIKPGNILLDRNLCPKVADFGLAKLHNRESSRILMTGFRGTPGYAAPEMWKPYPVTYKCDVYSFGMLMFEIVGRRRNHDPNLSESTQWLPRWTWDMLQNGELLAMVTLCGVPESEREKALRMLKVALLCIQYKPEARPAMTTVVKMLEGDMEIPTPEYPFEYLHPTEPYQSSEDGSGWDSESSTLRTVYSEGCCSKPVKQTAENEIELATR